MRYTIDKSRKLAVGSNLYRVMDKGTLTEAYASESVHFSDNCEIQRGHFYNGEFLGGTFKGGVFYGGEFKDGCFKHGTFYGGKFNGGMFNGGEYKSGWLPLQIQGSKHHVNIPDGVNIRVGGHTRSVEWWLERYKMVFELSGYTPEQIGEYKGYIDLAITKIEDNNGK